MSESLLRSFLVSVGALLLWATEATVFEAQKAFSYVVLPDADPYSSGGLYRGYMLLDRVFRDDLPKDAAPRPAARPQQFLADSVSPAKAQELARAFKARIEADTLADAKHPGFRLERPIRVTPEFEPLVAAEFRRIVRTGTMSASRQLVRPAHEVAIGIWLAALAEQVQNPPAE